MSSLRGRANASKTESSLRKDDRTSATKSLGQSSRKNAPVAGATVAKAKSSRLSLAAGPPPKLNVSKKIASSTPSHGPNSSTSTSRSDVDSSSSSLDGSQNLSLDSTLMAPPSLKLFKTTGNPRKDKKGPTSTPEGGVTEEMMEIAYTRYIQAAYIAKKSEEAKEKGMKAISDQLFTLFNATEKLRQESLKIEEETLYWDLMGVVGKSLKLIKEKIRPALSVMETVGHSQACLSLGLEGEQHYLPLKGVTLGDREEASQEMEKVSQLLMKFEEDFRVRKEEVEAREPNLRRLREAYSKLASDYGACLSLLTESDRKCGVMEGLATHEVSLLCSLKQLKLAEEEANKGESKTSSAHI